MSDPMVSYRDDPRDVAERTFRDRLAPLLALADEHPDATDLCVDHDTVRLDLGDRWLERPLADFPGMGPTALRAAASAAAVYAGAEFGPRHPAEPVISVKLPPDLRVTVVQPPMGDHWHLAIRFLRSRGITLDRYIEQGVMTKDDVHRIRKFMEWRFTMVISGMTGSGKTTLLRAILEEVAQTERLVILEDTPELVVRGRNVVHLQTTRNQDLAHLVQVALRLRPDRIVVGEVRGAEALEFLRAANTGHAGSLCTLHSNGGPDALERLHGLAIEGQPGYPFGSVVSAVHWVLHLAGRGPDRKLRPPWQVPDDWGGTGGRRGVNHGAGAAAAAGGAARR